MCPCPNAPIASLSSVLPDRFQLFPCHFLPNGHGPDLQRCVEARPVSLKVWCRTGCDGTPAVVYEMKAGAKSVWRPNLPLRMRMEDGRTVEKTLDNEHKPVVLLLLLSQVVRCFVVVNAGRGVGLVLSRL